MFGFLLLLSILVVAILVVGVYNSLIRLRNRVENAWAQIEVQLKRRNDLIPNLVETVKGYAKHEKGLFENVTKARSAVMSAGGVSEKAEASNFLSSTLKSLFAVVENYPELKANQNFIGLQNELSKTEDKITYARQFYNDITTRYNIRIQTVPSNIVAVLFKLNKKDLFEAPESERPVPKVEF